MASFSLPPINDNPDGGWGPSSSNFPEQFKFRDIPYAPYSKSDKLGRFADWNDLAGDGRQTAVGGTATGTGGRGGRGGGRSAREAFGTGTASAFATFQVEDDANFSVVDNRAGPVRRPGQSMRGKSMGRGGSYFTRGSARGGRGGYNTGRGGGGQRGNRRGWRDWDKVSYGVITRGTSAEVSVKSGRTRESSVAISPDWQMLDEVEFIRMSKLRLEVDEPEDLSV